MITPPIEWSSLNNFFFDKPKSIPDHSNIRVEFYRKSTLAISILALLFISPFAISHFLQGNILLGVSATIIMTILAACFWSTSRGHYYIGLNLYFMTPIIIMFLGYSVLEQHIIGILWCFPALFAFYFMLPERKAWLSNGILIAVILPCAFISLDLPLFARTVATLLGTSAFLVAFVHMIEIQRTQLQEIALIDSLTGLSNRSLLETTLSRAASSAKKTGMSMALLTIDLDQFKNINDQFGHQTGDIILKSTGKVIENSIRTTDLAFRTGGEEFVILLLNCKQIDGLNIAEKIRSNIEKMTKPAGVRVTASIGVAGFEPSESWSHWLQRSDKYMYQAKHAGRNAIFH